MSEREPAAAAAAATNPPEADAARRLEERAEYLEGLRKSTNAMTFAGSETDETGELTNVDNHPADTADFAFQRELDDTIEHILTEQEQQVRRAQQAQAEGRYGICEDCGRPIPPERLAVRPEATRCVECQRRRERESPADEGADRDRIT